MYREKIGISGPLFSLTGIMVDKGNYPQMALIQVSEYYISPRYMVDISWYIYDKLHLVYKLPRNMII